MDYKGWLKWRKNYFEKEKHMNKKNWKDLIAGLSMIFLYNFLFFNGQYTIEIAIIIAVLTLWWLEFF